MSRMNLRDRALAAMNHELPDAVPAHHMFFEAMEDYVRKSPYENAAALLDAWEVGAYRLGFVGPQWNGPMKTNAKGEPLDYFGCDMETFNTPFNDRIRRPLSHAETVADVENYDWPDPMHADFSPMRAPLEAQTNYLRVWGTWQPVFCRLSMLFGMERTMMHMALKPELIEAALAHIDHFYSGFYQKMVDSIGDCLDAVGYGDDFAGQDKLLIQPEAWRRLFKPIWIKWFGIAKARGLRVWMHSCGAIREVLPDLVDAGLDIWETVQAHLPGNEPESLKRDFGRHLCFAGGINTQHVLSQGTPAEVRNHVHERIRVLGRGGGYLCGPCHTVLADTPFENVDMLYRSILEFRGEGCTL